MVSSKEYTQFLLIGDSIVQFSNNLSNHGYQFGAGLAEHCSRRLDVVNRGLSGYTSSNILEILPDIVPSNAKVEYILLLVGTNDACLPEAPTGQHIPLEEYRRNLKSILLHPSIKRHSPQILLVTPPIVNEINLEPEDLKKGSKLTRHQLVTAEYARTVREIAEEFKEQNVVLVDLWTALMNEAIRLTPDYVEDGRLLGSRGKGESEGLRSLLVDGVHLTGEGYRVFLGEVLPHVGTFWAQEHPDSLSFPLLPWDRAPKYDPKVHQF